MAQRFCTGCGTPLRPDMVICPRCGKLVSSPKPQSRPQPRPRPQTNTPNRQSRVMQPTRANASPPRRRAAAKAAKPKPRLRIKSRWVRIACRAACAAMVIVAVYVCIFAVQVFRVKISTYDFKTEMKLESDCYGEAFDAYFKSGKWSVNPLTATCRYIGTSEDGDEYEIVFDAGFAVEVEKIYINGKEVGKNQIETRLMGMFI